MINAAIPNEDAGEKHREKSREILRKRRVENPGYCQREIIIRVPKNDEEKKVQKMIMKRKERKKRKMDEGYLSVSSFS